MSGTGNCSETDSLLGTTPIPPNVKALETVHYTDSLLDTISIPPNVSNDLLHLWLQSVQYDLQHDFAWVTDEAYCSIVLALLQVAFHGKCDD